jgi:hypothetical protein
MANQTDWLMAGKRNLLHFRREMRLDAREKRTVDRGIASLEKLIAVLRIDDSSEPPVAHYQASHFRQQQTTEKENI